MKNEHQKRSWKLAFGGDIALFLHWSILASHKYEQQLLNGTCFTRANTTIANEETGWKQLL